MGASLDPDLRARIVAEVPGALESGESLTSIGARFGVAKTTVARIAAELGVESMSRTRTQNATAAHAADMAKQRRALAAQMLEVARRALHDMDAPTKIYNFGGKDNSYNERDVDRPPPADQRNLMIIAATAIDKHRVLDGYDSDRAGASAVDEWLRSRLGRPAADDTPVDG